MKMRGLMAMMALMLSASYATAEQKQMILSVPGVQIPVTLTEIGRSTMPSPQPASSEKKVSEKKAVKKPAPAKKPAPVAADNSEAKELEKAAKEAREAAKALQDASREAVKAVEAAKTVENTKVAEKTAVAEKKVDLFSKEAIDKIADRADKPTTSTIDKKDFGYKFANCASAAAVGVGIKSQNSAIGGSGGAILISSYFLKKDLTGWDIFTSALCGGAGYLLAQAPPNDSTSTSNTGGGGGDTTTPPPGTSTGPVTPPPVPN